MRHKNFSDDFGDQDEDLTNVLGSPNTQKAKDDDFVRHFRLRRDEDGAAHAPAKRKRKRHREDTH